MDIRQPIRDTSEPTVLSVAFNTDCTRFVCGMANGLRSVYRPQDSVSLIILTTVQVFRAKDCIRTLKEGTE